MKFRFRINNPTKENLIFSGLPYRAKGIWRHGFINIRGSEVHLRKNTEDLNIPKDICLPPHTFLTGSFDFSKYILKPLKARRYKFSFQFRGTYQSGVPFKENTETDVYVTLNNKGKSIRGKSRKILRSVIYGLESYFVNNSTYPPLRLKKGVLLIPRGLTTPIAYIVKKTLDDNNIAIFVNNKHHSCWMVALKGADRDWDIAPLFTSKKYYDFNDIEQFAFDPTNGSRSSGDYIITSLDRTEFEYSRKYKSQFMIPAYGRFQEVHK